LRVGAIDVPISVDLALKGGLGCGLNFPATGDAMEGLQRIQSRSLRFLADHTPTAT
jgi:hypothetical protein